MIASLKSLLVVWMVSTFSIALDLKGIENCPNKCDKVFDKTQYAINDQPGQSTFEFRSCIIGCNKCATVLHGSKDNCFKFCKAFDYSKAQIRKGVIEPDKACIIGCVINTCQEVCVGGTTDHAVTPENQQFWWGLGGPGCSLKQGLGFVQNPLYGNPDQPGGQGATDQTECCTNAFNLCFYVGDKSTTNYANVQQVTRAACSKVGVAANDEAICAYYNNRENCGAQGVSPI